MTHTEARALALGAPVTFTATLVRRECRVRRWAVDKVWEEQSCAPTAGILVGLRTLTNGVRTYEGEEEGYSYSPRAPVFAALVAVSLRRDIVRVPLAALTVTE